MKRFVTFFAYLLLFTIIIQNAAYAKVQEVKLEVYDKTEQQFTPLDISMAANMAFADDVAGDGKGGWTDQGAMNDLSSFKLRGVNKLLGIDFNIIEPTTNKNKSCIVLRGQNDKTFPLSAEIKVGAKGAGVYFLHCAAWLSERVGQYTFVYNDGSEAAVEIVGNRDIGEWWGTTDTEAMRTAWKGNNLTAGMISIGLFALENPNPDKVINYLRLETYGDASYAMIVAATLTSKGPYLPLLKQDVEYNPDTSDWFAHEYQDDNSVTNGTALDASFLLDAPAGKYGFAKAKGDKIVFEDGRDAKFWGINVTDKLCFPEYKDSDYMSTSLAQRGFNLVRLHMMDVVFLERNIFGWNDINMDTSDVDKELLDRLFYLVYQLKEKGIYTFVDLCVSRQAKENDGVKDVKYLSDGLKYAIYYDEHLQKLQMDFTKKLMGTVNPYTGLTLGEDPAVTFVAFNNESSITHDNFESDYYNKNITEKYNTWLKNQYKTREELRQAWCVNGVDTLEASEDQFKGTVKNYGTNKRAALRGQRKNDNIKFLSETQAAYFDKMTKHYRSIGGKQMITGTTAFWNDMTSLMKSLSETDYIDAHKYFSHPSGLNSFRPGVGILNAAVSMIDDPAFGNYAYLSTLDLYGKPNTISEWNSCEFNPYISESPLMMAAYSGMHNWMPMIFAASSKVLSSTYDKGSIRLSNFFSINESPQVDTTLQAAAIAFHNVTEAEKGFINRYKGNEVYDASKQYLLNEHYMFAIGKTGFSIDELAYDPTYNSNDILYLGQKAIREKTAFVSTTNELALNPHTRLFQINTPNSQGLTGFYRDNPVEFDDVIIKNETEYATIILSSVTKKPIWESDRLLLTASARARNTGFILNKDGTKIVEPGTAPVLVEPVRSEITLKTKDNVEVYALHSNGVRKNRIKTEKDQNGYVKFCIGAQYKTNNYEVVKIAPLAGDRHPNPKVSLGDITVKPLFDDVGEQNDKRNQIERMVLQNFISGISETSFLPDAPIARGDFISMLVKALQLSSDGEDNFDDITMDMPTYLPILAAKSLGIVNGVGDNLLKPNDPLLREDMLAMINKALQHCESTNVWKDMVDGKNQNPHVTRAEAAAIVYSILWE